MHLFTVIKLTKHSIQVMLAFTMWLFVWDNNYIEEIKDASMFGFKSCHYNYIPVVTGHLKLKFQTLPLVTTFTSILWQLHNWGN